MRSSKGRGLVGGTTGVAGVDEERIAAGAQRLGTVVRRALSRGRRAA
jgi:hypothetical protein